MSEKKYRWPEIREKYRGANTPDLLVLLELLGLKEGVHLNDVEDLIDRMKAAFTQEVAEMYKREMGRLVFGMPQVFAGSDEERAKARADVAARVDEITAYMKKEKRTQFPAGLYPPQEQLRKPLQIRTGKKLEDCLLGPPGEEHMDVAALIIVKRPPAECPCGGPPGHVPGGLHCRR
jgi:hypothetical protein